MASSAITIFNKAKLNLVNATDLLNQTAANWRLALVSSAWTPNAGDAGNEVWADVSANEIANGNGYSTGGGALTGAALSGPASGVIKFTSNPFVWTASGTGIPAWRYGVLYWLGTANSKVNPLLGYFIGDNTPADIPLTTSGNTLTFTPNAAGILTLT